MKKGVVFIICGLVWMGGFGQGVNNLWVMGYADTTDQYTTAPKVIIDFSSGNPSVIPQTRKMEMGDATEGNISDEHGNLLMSSNGIWIANSTGDTMLNGSGLNPNSFTSDYSQQPQGLPLANGNVFLPYPDDSNKYILFHMTGNYSLNLRASELFYSVIDITQDGGLGSVILKNQIAFSDTLSWGIGACKHANGRDWWIIVLKDNSDVIYKVLLTPNGIQNVTSQHVGLPNNCYQNSTQITFSPDGSKFAYTSGYGPSPWHMDTRLFSFDRCSGLINNYLNINISDSFPGVCHSIFSKFKISIRSHYISHISDKY